MRFAEVIEDLELHVAKHGGEEVTEKTNTRNLLAALKMVEDLRVAAEDMVESVSSGTYASVSRVLGRLRDALDRLKVGRV